MADVVVVQSKVVTGSIGNDGTEALAFNTPTTPGNRVLVLYAALNVARTITGIADDGSNTYNQITGAPWTTGGTARQVDIWRAPQTNAASTVTLTLSGTHTGAAAMVILEVSGLAADEVDDTSSGESTTTSHDSGSVITTVADVLLLGATVGTTGAYTLDANFTVLADTGNLVVGYRDVDTQGTYSMVNTTAAAETTLTVLAAFKAEADAGGGTILPQVMAHYYG